MKPTQIHLFLMCLLATGCAAQSQTLILDEGGTRATGTDLWTRAVNIAGKNARWEAGKYTIRFEVRDGSGKVEQTQTMTYERKLSSQGSLIEKLVSATKDGEDVTAARRQEEESQQSAESNLQNSAAKEKKGTIQVRLYGKHPFDSDDQEAVTIERRDETRQIQNRTCQGYKFRFEQGDGAFTSGMAWLDVKIDNNPKPSLFSFPYWQTPARLLLSCAQSREPGSYLSRSTESQIELQSIVAHSQLTWLVSCPLAQHPQTVEPEPSLAQ
ncbi:MAG TPA: hypothetical protein VM425_10180 [Myxococcota bacterium]|nr:hypothetical protein [Myxococcota bacterium]